VIVIDTHVLLWWAMDRGQLSTTALSTLQKVEHAGGYASTISFWELATKVKRGKLVLPISVAELADRFERSSSVELVPVDTQIWLRSAALDWDHRDPADRVIVATAHSKGVSVLTKDDAIRSWAGISSVW
jgi:PIN domain nuclease of toxin-antitoxin system